MSAARMAVGLVLALHYAGMAFSQPLPAKPTQQAVMRAEWVNPHNNVKVETGPCGDNLCGRVVWATPEAEQDARDGGTQNLIGTELLQNYRQTGPDEWVGRVFVPDMGNTYYSTIKLITPDSLKVSGCILGGLICKSQVWQRA